MSFLVGTIGMSSSLLVSRMTAIRLTAAITIVVLFANVTITNTQAQLQPEQQPPQSSQPSAATTTTPQNATLFQSTEDSFRLQVPRGWVIHDMNNTGFSLMTELMQGYGILARLCPEAQGQALRNVGTGGNTFSSTTSCQDSGQGIIYILRYPNLGARLGFSPKDLVGKSSNNTMNAILSYEMEKLQEVGYRDIKVVNSTYATIKLDLSEASSVINKNSDKNIEHNKDNIQNALAAARVPAKLLEITYTTNSSPNETRTGYFMLTASSVTPRNLGVITGYSIFYEGNPKAASMVTATTAATTTTSRGLASSPTTTMLPAPVSQVFGSFELIAGKEGIQEILATLATQAGQAQQAEVNGSASPLGGKLTSNATEGTAPATFEFKANIVGGVKPYTFSWNFGDGTKEGNKQTVVHTFKEAGTYTVTATVIDGQHITGSAGLKIIVKEPSPSEQMGKTICDSSNSDLCIRPPTANSNCDDTSAQSFGALPPGLHTLDTNDDGTGCGSESSQGNSQPRNSSSEDNSNSGSNDNSGSPNSISLFDLLNSGSSTHAP